jgi:serine/threonine protein kinase
MNFLDLKGHKLGQYQLLELLGVGGMGAVYRGYQESLKREVAIKVMTPQLIQDPAYIARFTREAETAARLEHSHIVPVYDYGTEGPISYIVMRLLTGGTLDARLRQQIAQQAPLPSPGEVAEWLMQIAQALDYAHKQGVIHRDIKPSNVMFDSQGNAYLVDFGIAKLLYATSVLTTTGAAIGTPAYMAPEQWRAEEPTPATDQYAVAVMTYALLCGRLPFDAPTPYGFMHKHLTEHPTPVQTYRPDLPAEVTAALERALAKTPEERFPTVSAFAQTIKEAVRSQPSLPTGFFEKPVANMGFAGGSSGRAVTPTPATAFSSQSGPIVPVSQAAASSTRPAAGRERRRAYPALFGLATLFVAILLIAGAIGLLGRYGARQPPAAPGIATQSTPDATGKSPEPAAVSGLIVLASSTATSIATASPTPTSTHTVTPTATDTPTQTATPSDTPDVEATAEAMLQATLTAIAASWTDTPTATYTATPDIAASAQAMMTQIAASWTATPTSTPTPTATHTASPTVTPSLTPTPSPTRTLTPTPSPTSTRTPRPTSTPTPPPLPAECQQGFLPPRLQVGTEACVSDSTPNNLRDAPGSLDIIGQIPPGGIFRVLDGPVCTRSTVTVWWYVEYRGMRGWTAEGSKATYTYWLSPLPCPRQAEARQLTPGLDGVVLEVTEAGDDLNVRTAPALNAGIIDRLFWGDRVLWTGEESYADGYTWYHVFFYGGLEGYIAYRSEWLVTRDPDQTTPGAMVGKTIRITRDGDESHLRTQPSILNSREVQLLHEGDTLTIIGGPIYGDYYLWWELRLPDGRTGWLVDVPGWWTVQ